jgi:hypothetical protein
MNLFEYVMVLASIVIGLAMTHLLQGLLNIIQKRPRVYWVHLVWVGFAFFQTVFWWWWEFRYSLVEAWTLPLYLFIIGYAFLLYIFCGLLFPESLEGYGDFKTYFYKQRSWFFSVFVLLFVVDLVDTALKGATHLARLGLEYPIAIALLAAGGITAAIVKNERYHAIFAVAVLTYMVTFALRGYFATNT